MSPPADAAHEPERRTSLRVFSWRERDGQRGHAVLTWSMAARLAWWLATRPRGQRWAQA